MPRKALYKTLYVQVLAAIVCGVALGYVAPGHGAAMRPLGDGFIRLIKMMIAPIVFCTVVTGIAQTRGMRASAGLALARSCTSKLSRRWRC